MAALVLLKMPARQLIGALAQLVQGPARQPKSLAQGAQRYHPALGLPTFVRHTAPSEKSSGVFGGVRSSGSPLSMIRRGNPIISDGALDGFSFASYSTPKPDPQNHSICKADLTSPRQPVGGALQGCKKIRYLASLVREVLDTCSTLMRDLLRFSHTVPVKPVTD